MGKQSALRSLAAVFVGILIASLGLTSPASAHWGHHHHHGWLTQTDGYYQVPTPWEDSGSYDPECAGYDLTAYYDVHGRTSIKNIKGTSQAFFGSNQFRFREVWKDNASKKVLFTWKGTYKSEEFAAKRVKKSHVPADLIPPDGLVGPVFLFKSYEKFRDVFRTADGKKLFYSNAVNINLNLFDTVGDKAPGGVSLKFETIKRFGHDPLIDASPCDFLPAAN
jgi:hypothetical protein